MRVVVVPRLGKIQARFQISLVAGESLPDGVLPRQGIFVSSGADRAVGEYLFTERQEIPPRNNVTVLVGYHPRGTKLIRRGVVRVRRGLRR